MIEFFKIIIYTPLYNILVFMLNFSWVDAGIAAVLLTVFVKMILYPLAKKSIVTQIKMREKGGELNEIKEKYKDKQVQAIKIMEFYKENKINPFSSIGVVILQIPIIYSLYYIFFKSGLPLIDTDLLYSFVKEPASVSMNFLGLVDVSKKSIILALLASASTYFQMHLSSMNTPEKSTKPLDKEDFSKIMMKQMKYTLPIIVFFVSWQISGVVALYWFVSNLMGTAQDYYIKNQLKEQKEVVVS